MPSATARRRLRRLHRGLGLLVGLQLFFWVSGGLIMSSFELDKVRGRHQVQDHPPRPLSADEPLLPPADVLRRFPDTWALELRQWLQQPVYLLTGSAGQQLIDARTGTALSPLSNAQARAVAARDFRGDAAIVKTTWITDAALEYRNQPLPLWRVDFDDTLNTALYISPRNGRVLARRNDMWRVFDFVWMLHIMDYRQRENFNHPLLVGFAATTLAFVFSGIGMLWMALRR